ncbi:MAG TPA: hypothetical protein VN213_10030 [Solirubrobacteraceae bacterium]|nr:hypothetical protein [Solirubrobacteraceae bacterium]
MASADTKTAAREDPDVRDELIRAAEDAEAEHGGIRNLFDLRTIIGGLFIVYGAYLTIRGILDSQAAIDQAAGVRINLWTGLAALAIGGAFLAWALLRPLTLDEIVEGQAASLDEEQAHDALREEREKAARRPRH